MTTRRLAGIEIVALPPALPEALPRMDIAVFVGFAATGPVHVPVALESVADYANVFGPDAPLAWDCAKGERIHAHLGPSVRAFFSNGGRRCWVIRVARGATYNRFPLDGMTAAWSDDAGLHLAPAVALARCEGSWSDGLRVQTALQETAIPIGALQPAPAGTFTFATVAEAAEGDVLKLTHESGVLVFGRVGAVAVDEGERKVTLDRVASFSQGQAVSTVPGGLYESAKILAIDVRVSRAGEDGELAPAQGLAMRHPRSWMAHPTDQALYTASPGAATQARFPLAGAFEPPGDDGEAVVKDIWLIPLAVGADFGEARGPIAQNATALERDGLAELDPRLFLDPGMEPWQPGAALLPKSIGVLAEEADFLRYASPRPRRLSGIHAALGFDAGISEEATLICVPDAVHPGWERAVHAAPAPAPAPVPAPKAHDALFSDCEPAKAPPPQAEGEARPDQSPPSTLEEGDAWQMRPGEGFAADERGQALVDVHRALLRMCAARGELFAVLSLPLHYREREAIAHASRLNSGPGETSPATYGALYHPWPVDRRADASYFAFPPDGPVMGVLAARAFERGAWIAPANEVMNAFVALRPAVPMESWLALLEAQVNVLRLDARGFLLMSEDTLATEDDAELRPICVRRLLILLRRLALRRGANYVFEPHDDTLRRTVQRAFHEALSDLYARGAFAGRTPAQSFQVVTDETINTAQGVDAGRFFVDLKVAPSLPLSFLTVRLRQVGERLTASEGR